MTFSQVQCTFGVFLFLNRAKDEVYLSEEGLIIELSNDGPEVVFFSSEELTMDT
jgi:hypothetical protein